MGDSGCEIVDWHEEHIVQGKVTPVNQIERTL